ncbi:MAG: hypothetical protein K5854_01570 [Prevotella sp.]|nr:hypothetical protein [Prevotella sp.]
MKKIKVDNPRYPHTITIKRVTITEDNFSDDEERTEVDLYNGKGRSYTRTTSNGQGEVVTDSREASIPVRFDEWEEDKFPLYGDEITATIGNIEEKGFVVGAEADNNRTVIYWTIKRN